MGRLSEKRRGLLTSQDDRTKLTDSNGCSNLASPMAVLNTARVRLFATHSHNPLVVYKAFQFAIILAKILVLFPPRPLGYDCNDFWLLFLYSSHIVHEHACARAGSHLCTRLHCCTHGLVHHRIGIFKYTVHLHIPDGYICMWHTINLSGSDDTHTHKHCDMRMHSIPFIKLLLYMYVCTGH